MSAILLSLCFFVLVLFAPEDQSHADMLALARTANEQHWSDCSSGRMTFTFKSDLQDGRQIHAKEGMLEWDEDYQFFDGRYMYRWKAAQEGKFERDEDATLKILVSGKNAVARGVMQRTSLELKEETIVWKFPIASLKATPYIVLLPDYRGFLNSTDSKSRATEALNLLQIKAETPKGAIYERSLTVNGSLLTVAGYFEPGVRHTYTFDLEQGGLCIETLDEFEYLSPQKFWTTKRTLAQRADGLWYPKLVTSEQREGSSDADPSGVSTLEIKSFEPLKERRIKSPPSLSVFGPIPKGTWVREINEEGKRRTYEYGAAEAQTVEQQLLEQAKQIREEKSATKGSGK